MTNALLPLSGQMPDFAATIQAGQQAYQGGQDRQNQNALRAYLQQNGQAIMGGDRNAIAGLYGIAPELAQGILGDQQQMKLAENADNRGAAQLELARKAAAESSAESVARLSAAERVEAEADIDRTMAGATQAKTPEAWDALMAGNEHTKQFVGQFDQKDVLIAQALGIKDALAMGAPNPDRYKVVGGTLVDLTAEGGPAPVLRDQDKFREATPEEAAKFNAAAGQFGPDGKFYPINPPSGMTVYGPDGNPIVQTGTSTVGKPLTEGQSKDNFYLTAVSHAKDLDNYEAAISGVGGAANDIAGMIPFGKFAQSPEYQVGQVAAKEWGAAILRKESGAALTKTDQEWLDTRFIPVPGDKPPAIKRKRQARRAAEAGLKSGMNPEQIKAVVNALDEAGGVPDAAETEVDGYKVRPAN